MTSFPRAGRPLRRTAPPQSAVAAPNGTMNQRRLALAALVLLLLCAIAPSSSASPGQDPAPAATPAPSGVEVVWTGLEKRADGSFREVPLAAKNAEELRKELARVEVEIDVQHELERALRSLENLALLASRAGYAERMDVLVEVALARAELLAQLGREPEALDALEHLFPRKDARLEAG